MGSPLRIETKFVTLEEMEYIINKDIVNEYVRYELYRKTIFV